MTATGAPRSLLGHLATFIAVYETESFRGAAERIGRSQPAVTAQIGQLEDLLGVKLFNRTTRRVTPTLSGRELFGRASELVGASAALVQDFQSKSELKSGRLSVSVSPSVAGGLAIMAMAPFAAEFPAIIVSLQEDLATGMFDNLSSGKVEIGVGPYANTPEPLAFRPVMEQPFMLIAPRAHRLADAARVRFGDLSTEPLVCPSMGSNARVLLERAAEDAGFALKPSSEASQYHTIATMVAAGFGLTVMPLIDRRMFESLGLVARPFADVDLFRRIGVVSRRGATLSAAAAAFFSMLKLLPSTPGELADIGLRPLSEGPYD
jgi:DNA-binding transcriptional LysR family regulator